MGSTGLLSLFPLVKNAFCCFHLPQERQSQIRVASFYPEVTRHLSLSVKPLSGIGYRDALELTRFGFEDASKRGHCRPSGEVSKEMLERILQSGLQSKFLKNKWKLIIVRILEEAALD